MRPKVGIFDSGVGGLSVVDALYRMRPSLGIEYVADTALFPYGDRDPDEVAERVIEIAGVLIERGCSLLIVACNTASSAALEALRERYRVPIVGMEPPLKPAVERSRSGRVVVLATPATSSGRRLERLLGSYAGGADVTVQPMPGLADLVERGEVQGEEVGRLLHDALDAPVASGIDAVALGCTHYGFVRETLAAMLPGDVEIIDAAEPVARRAVSLLAEAGIDPGPGGEAGVVRCFPTGDVASFERTIERLRSSGASLPPTTVEDWTGAATAVSGTDGA